MKIPYAFVTFCDGQPADQRWDQHQLTRMLDGEEWVVPGSPEFVRVPQRELFVSRHGVAVMPMGHYAEHGDTDMALRQIANWIDHFRWLLIIATSDEGSTFPWHEVRLGPHARLWVMTPRPDHRYPAATRFIGEGSPTSAKDIYDGHAITRDLDVFFSGQINHGRRTEMWEHIAPLRDRLRAKVEATGGFARGYAPEEYLFHMTRSWVVPCPSGPRTQDSFRFYEALESGSIPIPDELRPDGDGRGYWEMIFGRDWSRFTWDMDDWAKAPDAIDAALGIRLSTAAAVTSSWTRYKRDLAWDLDGDLRSLRGFSLQGRCEPDDSITVIIPVSPIPSHPDTKVVEETLASIRERLPRAEILVGCDGVRPEQEHRRDAYDFFLQQLTFWANARQNIAPFLMGVHRHQSGIMHELLPHVRTPYVLFVEQDTPLEGDIPFDECLDMMEDEELALLRFSHEAGVLPEHEHLFLETEPHIHPYVRTIQFSARPHLARTDWYRGIVSTYWDPRARTFIEDILHGVMQAGVTIDDTPDGSFTDGKQVLRAWQRHRMAVYAPEGSWVRSGHLDGRGDDPKYPQHYRLAGPRPHGAPAEGEL